MVQWKRIHRLGRSLAPALIALALVGSALSQQVEATGSIAGPSPGPAVLADSDDPAPISAKVLAELEDDGTTDYWVRFDARADLSAAAGIQGWNARGQYVVDRLRETADAAQTDARNLLVDQGTEFQRFWISNSILVRGGSRATADNLAATPGVARIAPTNTYRLAVPERVSDKDAEASVGWNIADIGANRVWSSFGIRGQGVLVGTIDSGADYRHPALVESYAGRKADGTFDHNYTWFDPNRACTPTAPTPCDETGHGTSVLGVMVGDGGSGNRIGVAPRARWITAKACRVSTCDAEALLAAAQWMLAPTRLDGSAPDVSRRPQVINNSWGSADGSSEWFRDAVRAWEASGQFATFAGGDFSVGECASIASPASYPESYAVGGYNTDGDLFIVGQGPSPIDGSMKPEVTAPASQIRSSVPGGGYGDGSGTSYAAAHVAGAAALMLSARPTLSNDPKAIGTLLDDTARPADFPDPLGCGGDESDSNSYGHGRLDAFAAVQAVSGPDLVTVKGTVTDATSGDPIAGVALSAGPSHTTSTTTGRYTLFAAPGALEIHATAYGHADRVARLTAAAGATVTRNLALDPLPTARVTIKVSDGGGQGWPLDATVRIDGRPGQPGRTDPVTGKYRVDLPTGSHSFHVDGGRGYQSATTQVDVSGAPVTEAVALAPDPSCSAPGYALPDGIFEEFDTGETPDGWSLVNNNEDPFDPDAGFWRFDNPGGRNNLTGGERGFAIVDSDRDGIFISEDTELISPPTDLSGVADPVLRWRQDLFLIDHEVADVDVSTDGATWSNVWTRSGGEDIRGPDLEEVALPSADGVQVRFHYYDATFAWWWQVDDVLIGGSPCTPLDGGLIVGTVTAEATGAPLTGAEVAVGSTTTRTSDGRYSVFSADLGSVDVTASLPGFTDAVDQADVNGGEVDRVDLALGSGYLVVDQPLLRVTVPARQSTTVPLTLTNQGSVDAHVRLAETDRGFTGLDVEVDRSYSSTGVRVDPSFVDRSSSQPAPAGVDALPPWENVADLPHRLGYQTAATHAGRVYVYGGDQLRNDEFLFTSDELHVYAPTDDVWRALPSSGRERELAPGVFVGDRLHVVSGTDELFNPTATHQVYDVSERTWTTAAPLPRTLQTTTMARLGNDLITVGGCSSLGITCGVVGDVYRYHSATDTWTRLPDYPERLGFISCGGIDGIVYCSGGATRDYSESPAAYAYDPKTNAWSPIARSPVPTFGAGYAVTSGRLTIASGVGFGGLAAVNDVTAYDPLEDKWEFLPPVKTPTYYGAAACGFYRVGGRIGDYPSPFTRSVERLPGQACDADVRWLAGTPQSFVVPAGGSTTVRVKIGPDGIGQPGRYEAALRVIADTPGRVRPVQVMVRATNPSTWGRVGGVVTGLLPCGAAGSPLKNAEVTVTSGGRHVVVHTDADGEWSASIRVAVDPASVRVRKYGWVTRLHPGIRLAAGANVSTSTDLRPKAPCARVGRTRLHLRVHTGDRVVVPLRLANDGATELRTTVTETPWALRPLPRFDYRGWAAGTPELGDAPRTPPVPPVPGWFTAESSPSVIAAAGQAQCDGDRRHIYLVSGANGSIATDALWRFDALTNTWTELAALPQDAWPPPGPVTSPSLGVSDTSAVCEGGRIHLLGGTHDFETTTTHFVYNLASDSWTTAAPLPRPVLSAPVGVWNGRIYLVGGSPAQAMSSDEIDVYDIATDTWKQLALTVPLASDSPAWAQVGPYLYVVSGFVDLDDPDNLISRRLDLRTLEWSLGPEVPAERLFAGLAATRDAIYLLGGYEVARGAVPEVYRLATADWPDGEWTTEASLPERKILIQGACSETITGGEILTIGGSSTAGLSNKVLVHPVVPERCPTIRRNVSWLRTGPPPDLRHDTTARLAITLDARGLEPGTRHATLLLTTNDPGAPEIRIPVVLEVRR